MTTQEIMLNGKAFKLAGQDSIKNLINKLDLGDKRYAVEVNRKIIPKGRHEEYRLQSGDKVEIVQAIGGG